MPEHALIVTYALGAGGFGTAAQREAVYSLEAELETALDAAGVGEFDGNEFGGGEVVLYMYGPDADQLLAVTEVALRRFPFRPGHVLLSYGEVHAPDVPERRFDL